VFKQISGNYVKTNLHGGNTGAKPMSMHLLPTRNNYTAGVDDDDNIFNFEIST
jgi:hypothetical protein